MQHAQLEAVIPRVAFEQAGQIAALPGPGVADAVDNGQRSAVFFQNMPFRFRAENRDVVRPFHGVEARIQRVVIAVGQKYADAQSVQTVAAVAQLELGFDAVVFLIVDIAGPRAPFPLLRG